MKIFNSPDKWLVSTAICSGGLFIAYGHAGLPLAIAAPAVWVNWNDADLAMRLVAGGSALGAVALIPSFLCDQQTSLRRTSSVLSITALGVSAVIVMAVTEVWLMSAATSVPFVVSVGGFVASTMRQRRIRTLNRPRRSA